MPEPGPEERLAPPQSRLCDAGDDDYGRAADCGGAEVRREREGITEGGIRDAIRAGARIRSVLAIHRPSGELVPCFRFAGTPRWLVMRMRRYEASREWSTLKALQRFLDEEVGWRGPVTVVRETDPRLGRLPGIVDL